MSMSNRKGSSDVTGATVFLEVLDYKIKDASLIFCVFFLMYYLYEKFYESITVQYFVADFVNWVPRLTSSDLRSKLNLQTHS